MRHINIGFGIKEAFEDTHSIDKSVLSIMGVILDYANESIKDKGHCMYDIYFLSNHLLIEEEMLVSTIAIMESMEILEKEETSDSSVYIYVDTELVDEYNSQGFCNRGVEYYS